MVILSILLALCQALRLCLTASRWVRPCRSMSYSEYARGRLPRAAIILGLFFCQVWRCRWGARLQLSACVRTAIDVSAPLQVVWQKERVLQHQTRPLASRGAAGTLYIGVRTWCDNLSCLRFQRKCYVVNMQSG